MTKSAKHRNGLLSLGLFSLTLFLSAALMFAVEPMAGKMLLPLVGGTPSGWIVAMAFFQIMLLLGYFYAHLLSRFSPRIHALLYLAVLAAGVFFLPITMPPPGKAGAPGAWQIFTLLTTAAAVPFVALSAASSTLQRLFTTAGHKSSEDPYFLYAASNIGSFAGLLLYPFALEPAFGLSAQSRYWFYAFVVLAGLSCLCLALTYDKAGKKPPRAKKTSKITLQRRLEWIVLAFFPSSLLLGVTTHVSTDLFAAPMLWVLPLAIYLLTFVIAFSRRKLVDFRKLTTFQPLAVSLTIALLLCFDMDLRISWYSVVFNFLAFGTVALMCHMQLAQQRPVGDDRGLTDFYLMLSVGGALGGILNAFIVPVVLNRPLEYPVMMVLSCLLNPVFRQKMPPSARGAMYVSLGGVALYILYRFTAYDFIYGPYAGAYTKGMTIGDTLIFVTAVALATTPRGVLYGGLALLFAANFLLPREDLLYQRNFFGVLKVFERQQLVDDKIYHIRYLVHGTTTHGVQVREAEYEKTPTTYFWKGGPAGNVFDAYAPKKIAVIGLGAGTLNCYSTPANEFTFFEINPAAISIASNTSLFTFLSACKGKRPPRIIEGDGRLEMQKLPASEKFDLITLDAFSSDAIPAHLLTLEALKVYLDHLNPKGILLLHISNRYFNLSKILAVNARELNLKSRVTLDNPKTVFYAVPSIWYVMARPGVSFSRLDAFGWDDVVPENNRRPWTDDYTNPLSVLMLSGFSGDK